MALQALCHSSGAGYTLCLFVIPSDSIGARGQTCDPKHSFDRKGPEKPEKPGAAAQVPSPRTSTLGSTRFSFCPLASFHIASRCFCLSTTSCHVSHRDASHPAAVATPDQFRLYFGAAML